MTNWNKQESRKYKSDSDLITFNGKKDNPNKWLSSLGSFPFHFNGVRFHSSEQLYRYYQFNGNSEAQKAILSLNSPQKVRAYKKHVDNEPYYKFNRMKLNVFFFSLIVKTKYSEEFKKKLISTEDRILIEVGTEYPFAAFETNGWYEGKNLHGRFLGKIRQELKNGSFDKWSDEMIKEFLEQY